MAQQVIFWKMEGVYDIEIKTVRLRKKSDLPYVMAQLPAGTDVVTLNRTDKQSLITHEIWHSDRYVDLNDRAEPETQEEPEPETNLHPVRMAPGMAKRILVFLEREGIETAEDTTTVEDLWKAARR